MLIHHYDNQTGQYCGSQLADADPRSPGRWLLPAFATDQVLPERTAETWPFFSDGAWVLLPDFRGKVLYRTDTGERAEIVAPGIRPQDIGLTVDPRPSNDHVWKEGTWQLSAEQVAKRARDEAMAAFNEKMEIARQANAGKADAYAAGLLSDVEVAIFKAWAAYQMDLVRVLSEPTFPERIDWPHEPDVEAVTAKVLAEKAAAEQLEKERAAEAAAAEAAQAPVDANNTETHAADT
jgi:hypothetical protein